MFDLTQIEFFSVYFIKIITATLCGIIVGAEREYKYKPAGVRTMVLICAGCAILTTLAFDISPASDPSRIIAQIITGIGFLGGGVIIKIEDRIIGVTTASFIWVMAAIGIMIGIGHICSAIALTVGLLVISVILVYVEDFIKRLSQK
jgi:putative Mg2+ transporter-C (MgtC) family protein